MKNEKNKIEKWINRALIKNTYFQGITVLSIAFGGGMWLQDNIIDKKIPQPEPRNNLAQDNKCDSDFLDIEKWTMDGWWKKDGQVFTYKAEKLFGGPKMVFSEKKSSDSFISSFEFMPVENIDNEDKEINLVVYVGDLYKVVFEKVYEEKWKNEIESFDSFYVEYIKSGNKASEYGTDAKIIKLKKGNISFNKWTKMKIDQKSSEGSLEKKVIVEILYIPDNSKNGQQEQETYVFDIEGVSSFGNIQRDIKIGLQIGDKKSTFITKFRCFKLKNI